VASQSDAEVLSFSIVIPTYQGRDTVCEALESICALSWGGSAEVVLVVDGSTDGTVAALRQVHCRFPLRIVEQPNQGLAAARNRGAEEADGTILLFLDDDMICPPDLLEQHAGAFREGADAVVGSFTEVGSPIASLTSYDGAVRQFGPPSGTVSVFDIYGGHLAVRKAVFEAIGGFDASFTKDGNYGCEDRDLGSRLLERFVVAGNPDALCEHRKQISPMDYVRRARQSARSEAKLLENHPELRGEMIRWSGAANRSNRLRLLSQVPLVPQVIAACVGLVATIAARTPLRRSRRLERLCHRAYALNYWSSVYRGGALPELWGRNALC